MSSKWPNLTDLCVKLGERGINPEALTIVGKIHGYLNDEVRAEYKDFMDGMRQMFAPVEELPVSGLWPDWGDRPDGFDGPTGAE